jgi:hypothetical protein
MLWIALFLLIFGRPESLTMLPKFNKNIKKYVVEDVRKRKILEYSKAFKKSKKDFLKDEKVYLKHFAVNSLNRNTPNEFFEVSFQKILLEQRKFNQRSLKKRLEIQYLIKEDEWKNILEASQKGLEKQEKDNQKAIEKLNNVIEKIKKDIVKHVGESKKKKTLEIAEQLQSDLNQNIAAFFEINYLKNDTLRNLNATIPELQAVIKDMNQIRKDVYYSIVDARSELIENTTEQEWEDIVKSINKLLKLFVKSDN